MPNAIPPAYEGSGYRRILSADGTMQTGRLAIELPSTLVCIDEPATATRPARTRLAFFGTGIDPDGASPGGYYVGYANGGWITVRSDAFGFRVLNAAETGYALTVDNAAGSVIVNASLQLAPGAGGPGQLLIGDSTPVLSSLGSSAVAIQSASGQLKVTQFAPPTATGSRGGNAALASLLTALVAMGLIVDSTTA